MHQIWIKEDIYSNAYHNMTNEATWLYLSSHVLKIRGINHVWYVLFVLIQFQFFILVLTTKICPYDHPQISTYYEICYPLLTSIYLGICSVYMYLVILWISDVVIIALVSKVHVLVVLSNFAQCALPCAHLNPIARIPWAPNTMQNLKVTLKEWLLKLTLFALHQIFRPTSTNR